MAFRARKVFGTFEKRAPGTDNGLVIFDWFVLSMRMQVILESLFDRPGSAPIWGGRKGEFRDWTGGPFYRGWYGKEDHYTGKKGYKADICFTGRLSSAQY